MFHLSRILNRLLAVLLAGSLLVFGWVLWRGVDRVEALFQENAEMRAALANLLVEDTLGYLYERGRRFDAEGRLWLDLTWMETAAPDHARTARVESFAVRGDTVYLDGFLIKVPGALVAGGEGRALYLWRRAFGSEQEPEAGFLLGRSGEASARYAGIFEGALRGQEVEHFWNALWELAHDPERLAGVEIEAVFGNAVAIQPRPGFLYTIKLSAGGALSVGARVMEEGR